MQEETAVQRLARLVARDQLVELTQVHVPGYDRVNPKTGKIEHVDGYTYTRRGARKVTGFMSDQQEADAKILGVLHSALEQDARRPRVAKAGAVKRAEFRAGRGVETRQRAVPGGGMGVKGRYDPKQPLKFWGDRLRVADPDDDVVRENLDQLAQAPEGAAYSVRNWMAQLPGGGIYVGRGSASQVAQLDLTDHPRGWSASATWSDVDGVYSPIKRRVGLGHNHTTDIRDSNDKAHALHELGHALDHAFSQISQTDQRFLLAAGIMQDGRSLNPYYTAAANPDGWRSELFAQSFSAWARGKNTKLNPEDLNRYIRNELGAGLRSIPEVDQLIAFFDDLENHLKTKYRQQQDAFEGKR